MASPGLLLLLLVSSSLLLSTRSNPSPTKEDEKKTLENFKTDAKKYGKLIRDHADLIKNTIVPILGLIPIAGPFISAIASVALSEAAATKSNEILGILKTEFANLNFKIDEYHKEQKWDVWASQYGTHEVNINVAWSKFLVLIGSVQQAKDDNEKEKHRREFTEFYKRYEPAIQQLYELLKTKGTSFTTEFGGLLMNHVNCHEKDIREFTVFINEIIMKGITLNHFYYKLETTECQAKIDNSAQITYECASLMFQIHKNCILKSISYVQTDVMRLIDSKEKKDPLAHTVRSFLAETYDRYDWMVVAFKTKNSKRDFKNFDSHTMRGFTEVPKGEISVAVARQVKGTHTKERAVKVQEAINKCVTAKDSCHKIADKLDQCEELVDGMKVSETYTAVHAYIHRAHQSVKAQEAPKEEEVEISADPVEYSTDIPYIYTGECAKYGVFEGKFVVMIKSDEEFKKKDPCQDLNCGGDTKGKCVSMEGAFVAMCECELPYYGQNCEHTLDEYKKDLMGSIDAFNTAMGKTLPSSWWSKLLSNPRTFFKSCP